MLGVEGRRFDRLLQVHAEMDVAQEHVERPLVLLVAARRAERQIGLAVAQREGGREHGPRQKPSSGITGELCSQPPEGVAETMLPWRSMTSR